MSTVKLDPKAGFDVKFAAIAASASGASPVVAAVAGKRIRVLNYTVIAATAVGVKFQSAANDITGVMNAGANGGASANGSPLSPQFETNAGEALNINLSSAVAAGGHLCYQEI